MFAHYRKLNSLEHYLLVSQKVRRVEKYSRQEGGIWVLSEYSSPDSVVELAINIATDKPLKLSLSLRDVYEGIDIVQ